VGGFRSPPSELWYQEGGAFCNGARGLAGRGQEPLRSRGMGAERQATARLFARVAERYDLLNDLNTLLLHRRWRRRLVAETLRGLEPGPALDIATGTGDLALLLARQPSWGPVVGLDLLLGMLARARARARRQGLAGRVLWVRGDALALPFPEGAFACALLGFALRNVPDPLQALQEAVRVVRPGGRVGVLEAVHPEGRGPLARLARFHLGRVVPLLGALVAHDRPAYEYLARSAQAFGPLSAVRALMEWAGLEAVACSPCAFGAVALCVGTRPR